MFELGAGDSPGSARVEGVPLRRVPVGCAGPCARPQDRQPLPHLERASNQELRVHGTIRPFRQVLASRVQLRARSEVQVETPVEIQVNACESCRDQPTAGVPRK